MITYKCRYVLKNMKILTRKKKKYAETNQNTNVRH